MQSFETIDRPKSLTNMVIERLRDSIVDGTIHPGALLSEKQIADQFGTSKTPVREAFAHLQSLGLVEVHPQRGGLVFRPSVDQVRELCEVRLELEVIAFRLAMERNRLALAEHLTIIVQRMIETYDVSQSLPYLRLDSALHYSFFTHCGNSLLAKAYDWFTPRIGALRTQLSAPQSYLLNRSFEEHKLLLDFVRQADVTSAVLLLREHINRTRECHSRLLAGADAFGGR